MENVTGYEEEDVSSYRMNLKEMRCYCKLKDGTLDRTLWRTRFEKRLWICRKTTDRAKE